MPVNSVDCLVFALHEQRDRYYIYHDKKVVLGKYGFFMVM